METLLIAEGNKIIREGMVTVLRAAGYNVLAFGDGREALNYLQEHLRLTWSSSTCSCQ